MKKHLNLIKSIAFLVGFVLIVLVLSFVFAPKDNRKEFGYNNTAVSAILAEKENSVDVVILGDSESYCTFSPIL
ncbi:MAG: SGNH/GDSL hydrolase family protein, partial [Clostridia bacterium]